MIVAGADGRVLSVERADSPGSWQLPQGGIKSGESPALAAARELEEETGLTPADVRLLAESSRWHTYVLPSEARTRKKLGMGQTQRWFLYALESDESMIRADGGELASWRWMRLAELAEITVPFRRPVYRELVQEFVSRLA